MKQCKFTIFLIIAVFFSVTVSFSQLFKYKITEIPDSIKKHADAVIRFKSEEIIIKNISKATYKTKVAVTILKKSGEDYSYIVVPYNKLIKFVSLHGRYYDKDGILINNISKKNIIDISSYSGLFSDNRMKLVDKSALTPPYTVEYEYETERNGILNITDWMPVFNYNLGLEKAVLTVSSPKEYKYRVTEKNFNGKYSCNGNTEKWILENIKPVLYEPYNVSISNLVPEIMIAPDDFSVEGFRGNMKTWENFGKWITLLNNGRDELPEETVTKIKELVKNIPDKKLKAKTIYEYMQNKTRYVSIQLGIGGWQPFDASYTDRNGYGDCKALSYYTQSLLKAVGIKSYYAIINAGENTEPIQTDFPSLQFNHVILCLPLESDTTWMECTNQKIPFGYLSSFTDDRNALLITENGGKLVHTVSYSENQNTQIRKGIITLLPDGKITADVHTVYKGLQYDNVSDMEDLPEKDKQKKIKNRFPIPSFHINSFKYKNHKEIIPFAEENLKFAVDGYASVSSGRLFLIPNLLNRKIYIPKKIKNRKTEIDLRFAYTDIDTLIYNLPDNLISEYVPENINYKTKFGEYSVTMNLNNHKLVYVRKVIMHKGKYPSSDYSELRKFIKFISNSDKQSLVFKISE